MTRMALKLALTTFKRHIYKYAKQPMGAQEPGERQMTLWLKQASKQERDREEGEGKERGGRKGENVRREGKKTKPNVRPSLEYGDTEVRRSKFTQWGQKSMSVKPDNLYQRHSKWTSCRLKTQCKLEMNGKDSLLTHCGHSQHCMKKGKEHRTCSQRFWAHPSSASYWLHNCGQNHLNDSSEKWE